MKFKSPVWLILIAIVCVNCSSNSTATNPFTKQVEVFGIHVYATEASSDDKIIHAANVLAEYLDNDEDGNVDNQKVLDFLVEANRVVPLWSQSDSESFYETFHGCGLKICES